jgi:hypothetical protein
MAGAITSRSDLVGACLVVRSDRARNCKVPCRAAGFLSCKAVVQSPVISENETYRAIDTTVIIIMTVHKIATAVVLLTV